MLNKKIYYVLGENKDLGNKLHAHYIYESDSNTQIKIKSKIDDILKDYSDKKLLGLAYDKITKKLIQELISLKKEKNWSKILNKILKGLSDLLEREIEKAKPLSKPKLNDIKREFLKIPIYDKSDIIKIKEERGIVKIDYLSKKFSPKYDPKKLSYYGIFEPWRDTQLIFTLNFKKNLFIWDYINVHKLFHGKKIGTKCAKFVENLARDFGFTRFSVEYPNRAYWIKKLNYKIHYKNRISSGRYQYTLEGYKEV
jgi:hypothetical protein|tara:strand:- start:969 stop:1730 length:762 start_codon:yes stop_codon:yes gene_type:complete